MDYKLYFKPKLHRFQPLVSWFTDFQAINEINEIILYFHM